VTPEVSVARRLLTAAVLTAALLAAVILQLTVVNRLPLPGAGAPDLVLLLVTAIAVAISPLAGAVSGFAAGLALDVAPPAAHYAGQDALVFCLAGYAAARVAGMIRDGSGERVPAVSLAVLAAAAAAGEAGKAAVALALADPDVTGAAVSRVLPSAVLYDLLLAPVAFWLVSRVTRGRAAESAPVLEFTPAQRLAGAFRQASAGAAPVLFAPRKRLAGSGPSYRRPSPARAVPRLRLADSTSSASARTSAAWTTSTGLRAAAGRTPRLNFAGDSPSRTARPAALSAAGSRSPRAGWLRSAHSGSGRSAGLSRSSRIPRTPRFSRNSRGLRFSSGTRGSALGSGVAFRRGGIPRRNWHTAAPSRSWLRRSDHRWHRPWHRRLLRRVGVGR
jgi:rod shape-determining protein MreD